MNVETINEIRFLFVSLSVMNGNECLVGVDTISGEFSSH